MNWEALGAIAEALGAAGVIASLVYLAGQIRQNSRLLRASTASSTLQTSSSVSGRLVENPELARIYFEGMADRRALSTSDRQRFDPLISEYFDGVFQEYELVQDGIVGSRIWGMRKRVVRWMLQSPGVQQWWSEWRWIYDHDFVDFVDGLIREPAAAS